MLRRKGAASLKCLEADGTLQRVVEPGEDVTGTVIREVENDQVEEP